MALCIVQERKKGTMQRSIEKRKINDKIKKEKIMFRKKRKNLSEFGAK